MELSRADGLLVLLGQTPAVLLSLADDLGKSVDYRHSKLSSEHNVTTPVPELIINVLNVVHRNFEFLLRGINNGTSYPKLRRAGLW